MALVDDIRSAVVDGLAQKYQQPFSESDFQINQTKPEFEGDYSIVLFFFF